MNIIGIDPGATGALVLLDSCHVNTLAETHMPILNIKGKKVVDPYAIASWLKEEVPDLTECTAMLESVHAMPGQGVTSMFSFGRSLGVIEGVLGALSIPCIHVSPQKWKSIHGFNSKDKDEPRSNLIRRFPQWAELRLKGKGQALADAYYIAKTWTQLK